MNAALAFDLAWKSGVVAALVLTAVRLLRSRQAVERVVLLRLGVVVILALPLLTVLAPALRIQAPALTRFEPAMATQAAPAPSRAVAAPSRAASGDPTRIESPALPLPRVSPMGVLTTIWLVGVAILSFRLLCGVAALTLWTRRATPVTDPLWRAALDRAVAGRRPPCLKVSTRVASPLSWNWPRGVILIDEATLSRPDRADAVLTHEMGHVRHHDWLFLMLSHVLVAVLWLNPLVWRLQRELARQSEQAADAWAVRCIDRIDYAGALVAMARGTRPHAALGMAGPSSDLAHRVAAVLNPSHGNSRPWITVVAAIACVGMAGPLAALEWAPDAAPAKAAARAPSPDAGLADDLSPEALAASGRPQDEEIAMTEARARPMEAPASTGLRAEAQVDLPRPGPTPIPMPLAAPVPPPSARDEEAAGMRVAAQRLRIDADQMNADALRIEQDRSRSEETIEHIDALREQASELRQEADDLDREAADVMSG